VNNVTLSRTGGDNPGTVEQTVFDYYDDETDGNQGDLESATLEDAASSPLATYYYRYETPTDAYGGVGRVGNLTFVVTPSDDARLVHDQGSPGAVNNATLAAYAAYHYYYNTKDMPFQVDVLGAGTRAGQNRCARSRPDNVESFQSRNAAPDYRWTGVPHRLCDGRCHDAERFELAQRAGMG
jgi:hypothetical protein